MYRGWFVFDVLAIIPYYFLNDTDIYGIRYVRFLQLPWTMKSMREFWEKVKSKKFSNFSVLALHYVQYQHYKESLSHPQVLPQPVFDFSFTFFLLITGNLLSCFWFL